MEKNFRTTRLYKVVAAAMLLLVAALAGMIYFSPFGKAAGYPYKVITNTVEIDASVDSVYRFLGNSANATRWSVFVNHITPLNNDSFPDGIAGSRRRCFCQQDEQGMQWDELITEVVPNQKRQLTIYNLQNFPMTAANLATEQLYEPISNSKCRLTFTVFFKDAEPTLYEQVKTYFAAYEIQSIFEQNMANIKRINETGR
ncbi:SRPBCC family protein [Botryobacter ruber]|uniref:SRPBCC family protein n=1 Tax=Botryobacter ruber TaxID=2171629 RepID=UPI0013E40CFE|nr:SRPBCC family protein [Botryobacter ruber]